MLHITAVSERSLIGLGGDTSTLRNSPWSKVTK